MTDMFIAIGAAAVGFTIFTVSCFVIGKLYD